MLSRVKIMNILSPADHVWTVLYFLAVVVVPIVSSVDKFALIALKSQITYDPQGILATNWTTESPYCSWYGISCFKADHHQESRVSGINISNMGLQGRIPPQIGNLSFLVSLDLSNNYFHATLPHDIGKCKELQQLNLYNNKLVGRIPDSICNLSKLEELNLGTNQLIGEIPKEMSLLLNLKVLWFEMNNLTGIIPSGIGNLVQLRKLSLRNNSLTGEIPCNLSHCGELQILSLSGNRLTGGIPGAIGNLSNLEELYLAYNKLTGEIPSSLSYCQELRMLSLLMNQLSGDIPQAIGSLSNLQELYLGYNKFTGGIPKVFVNLSSLNVLVLNSCGLGGTIPTEIFNISSLLLIDFSNNNLSGSLPMDICKNLPNLYWLYLDKNHLSGELPSTLSLCGELLQLELQDNNLVGSIPSSLGNLKVLTDLSLAINNLTGRVPEAIFNLSKLQSLELSQNHLSGHLPSSIGTWLSDLAGLFLEMNEFRGIVPMSISNMSKLSRIDISENSFSGSMPKDLGNLTKLEILDFENNQFTEVGFLASLKNCQVLRVVRMGNNPLKRIPSSSFGHLPLSLDTFTAPSCQLGGTIPIGISNLSNLISLDLGGNDLTGSIPATLGQLQKLQYLKISENRLQGSIPNDLCYLKNLWDLRLSFNRLSGSIPRCFEDLHLLRNLYLDSNALASEIPSTLWRLKGLLVLNLSSNFLTGNLPPEVGNMKSITVLDLSKNQLSGCIPGTMGQLQNVRQLSLSRNRLQGQIPEEFHHLLSLDSLNLSCNNLSGIIPKSLEALIYLNYLNLSFNQLEGEIPDGGPFVKFGAESFISNKALCGAPRFQVMACQRNPHGRFILKYILLLLALVVTLMAFVVLWIRKRDNLDIPTPTDESWLPGRHGRISQQQLLVATDHFREENLIGKGSLSMVYEGVLSNGLTVAVKVFNLDFQGALRSFDSESQVMQRIRHRNLVKIITCCSNIDFKALVLEYMPNGSLEKWLYSHNYFLDLIQRLNIMIDVASALEYLHHDSSSLVVHCDLKPSNVLLDDDMIAHVADFGIARLLGETERMQQTRTLGTIGYMAPEYGSNGIVSTKGDVCSYGILLMEVFARKKPMDEMFSGELTLKNWVESSLSSSVTDIVDANLFKTEEDGEELTAIKLSCVSSIMALALACTTDSPWERMEMKDVVVQLKKIRIKLLV